MVLVPCTDVCTFVGGVISSRIYRLISVGRDRHLQVGVRTQAGCVALAPGRVQKHSLHAAPSAKVNVDKE